MASEICQAPNAGPRVENRSFLSGAEKQEKFNDSFYTSFDDSLRLQSPSPAPHAAYDPLLSADIKRAVNHMNGQRHKTPSSDRKPKSPGNRNARTKANLRCYECEGVG